jgi:hypothetical protein
VRAAPEGLALRRIGPLISSYDDENGLAREEDIGHNLLIE